MPTNDDPVLGYGTNSDGLPRPRQSATGGRHLLKKFRFGPMPASPVLVFVALAVVTPWLERAAAQSSSCRVTTASGAVQGLPRGETCTYLGVPYGAAPVGNLRWKPPQPRAPWAPTVLNASTTPQVCPQIVIATGAPTGSEDCLTLNIWTPATAPNRRLLPVMVWLHTGGFQAANANSPASDGARFAAERNAIVVAPNYRLGPLGFLSHRALTQEDPAYQSSGNYGLADQRAALRWVRENIAVFGGDPEAVTLAGTSAGASSVTLHLVSPLSQGLFQRGIIQSGYALSRGVTLAEAEIQGDVFAAALGCSDPARVLTCMRAATPDRVLRALPIGQAQFLEEQGRVAWGPVVDGLETPDQARELFRQGRFRRVPIIVGTNRDEGTTFVDRSFPGGLDALGYERAVRGEFGMDAEAVLRQYPATAFSTPRDALIRVTGDVDFVCEARRLARALYKEGAPVYLYSFDYPVDEVTPGRAFHGLESNLLFGNDFAPPTPHVLTPADLVVFDAMSTYWRQFMETGDPNPPGRPVQWPHYIAGVYVPIDVPGTDRHFVFADRLGVSSNLRDSPCNFWEGFFFRSVRGAVPAAAR